ncbi:WD40/YVTN/BNR-like repeat-containing protein [Marinicella gelatinilytica]|uniref:WD40/YVTN/BNR-like repeat-containing protein n=1 Tax=Marinicella gelatinilytica TaxID=2996017 RepID=UPI002260B1E8|nr:YCF48-related protein [Marinicella gelatinilytica]MCX7544281.1 YCF48-related protein [Marinicella gelatinilytica]
MIIKNTCKLVVFVLLTMSPLLSAQEVSKVMPLADEVLILSVTNLGNELVAVGEHGHVLKSSDQGETWRQIENVPVNILLTKVFSVKQLVWAVGHDATIIHSSDGGETWTLQFYDPDRQMPLLSVYFIDAENGFAIGAYGTIMTTYDGGENWEDDLIHDELDYHLNDITMANDGHLYVAGEAGYGFISADLGDTWQAIELPYPGSMFGVLGLQDEVIMFGLRGHVLSSIDQGQSWQEIPNKNLSSLFGGDLLDENSAIMVGANGARVIYKDRQLTTLSGSSALEIGDDYADVLILDNGQKLLLFGEEGSDIQSLAKP